MLCYATPDKLHLFRRTPKYTTFIYKVTSKGQRFKLGQKEAESGEQSKYCCKMVVLGGDVPHKKTYVQVQPITEFYFLKSLGNLR